MTFEELAACIPCSVVVRGENYDSAGIKNLVVSDLMSDVLTRPEENFVIVTSLNSDQVVRTADIVGAVGVLLVNGKQPQEHMKALAEEHRLTLFSTPEDSYHVCLAAGKVLEKDKA